MEFPRKFQNSKIPKFFGRCFGIQEKILEFWNFLGNSKKNFGVLEFPGKFQKKTLEFWNSLENSKKKKLWNFGILEFSREFQNSKVFFWNFPGNSKTPKFFFEFPRKFQNSNIFSWIPKHLPKNFGILEFWNFLGNSKIPKFFFWISQGIPKFQSFFLEFPRKFQNSNIFSWIPKHLPKNFRILEFWNFLGNSKIPFFFGIS